MYIGIQNNIERQSFKTRINTEPAGKEIKAI